MPVFSGKPVDVFGKIWACFFRTSGTFFLRIGKYFHLSAQYTFSANRKTYIFAH